MRVRISPSELWLRRSRRAGVGCGPTGESQASSNLVSHLGEIMIYQKMQMKLREKFCTIDIPRKKAEYLLDIDLSLVDNLHVGRLRAIRKQLENNE